MQKPSSIWYGDLVRQRGGGLIANHSIAAAQLPENYWAETVDTQVATIADEVLAAVLEVLALGAVLALATGLMVVATSEQVAGCTMWLCMGAECTGRG